MTSMTAVRYDVSPASARLLHVNAAADLLGLLPYQVRVLIDDGRLPSERIGNRTYIPTAALAAYIERIEQTA